ncbi:MAG TPA: dienelactone hydrolase family protein [Puia sp.]|nr:dienelactone hydrolase family protein [Puia sp.]
MFSFEAGEKKEYANLEKSGKKITYLLIFSIFSLCYLPSLAQYPAQKPVTAVVDYAIHGYLEWLPADYNQSPSKKYPLLIFLHGMKEIGNGSKEQLTRLLKWGPPKIISDKKFPLSFNVDNERLSFIVLSPQFISNARNFKLIDTLINYALIKYRIDPERIYLTGMSMGGGIAWLYAGAGKKFSQRLAGLYVVSGNTKSYPPNVRNIIAAHLPVKAMHNSGDSVVPASNSIDWVKNLNTHFPPIQPKAELTLFDENAHDAWTKSYDPAYKENGKNAYEWMLSHKRIGFNITNSVIRDSVSVSVK